MPVAVRFPLGAYRANLYVYDPFGRIDWYALPPQSFEGGKSFTFGRGPDCDIALNDGAVSTRHACVRAEVGRLALRDLGSTNGTLINGDRVDHRVLEHGDVLRLGATDVRFLYSYRTSPVRLGLNFVAGPHAGGTSLTEGASTSIGHQNCAVNLAGEGVAAQHVRIDAYGPELVFVVNLQKANATWLNGQRVVGIVPARAGDRLRVGEHEVIIEVRLAPGVDTRSPTPIPTIPPPGSATLALSSGRLGSGASWPGIDDEDRTLGNDNDTGGVVQLDVAVLEAELAGRQRFDPDSAGPSPVSAVRSGDVMVVRPTAAVGAPMTPSPGLFLTPTQPPAGVPPEGFGPTRELRRDAVRQAAEDEPEDRWRDGQREDAAQAARDDDDLRPRRARRGFTAALFLSVAGGLVVGAAALWAIPQPRSLDGRLSAGIQRPLLAPVTGRIDELLVRPGDVVNAGALVARLTDAEVAAEVAALTAEITALEGTLQPTKAVIRVEVPPVLRRKVSDAQTALDAAREARRAMLDAYNRREVGLDRLEGTRAAEVAAQGALAAARAELAAASGRETEVETPPPAEEVSRLAQLQARREQLKTRVKVVVHAAESGLVTLPAGAGDPAVGNAVEAGAALLAVLSLDPLEASLDVDERTLRDLEAAGGAEVTVGSAGEGGVLKLVPAEPLPLDDGRFRVRLVVPNADGKLRPGVPFVARFEGAPRSALRLGIDALTGGGAAKSAP